MVYRKHILLICCLLIFCLYFVCQVPAGHAESATFPADKKQEGVEKEDGAKTKGRWLPIPIFATEPAFGYGGGVAMAYFHPEKKEDEIADMPSMHSLNSVTGGRSGQKAPPTITAVAGGYTNQATWAAAVGHSTTWYRDTIRYAGGLAYINVNSSYYILNDPLEFTLKGTVLYQDIKFRLGESHWFLGTKLLYLDTNANFHIHIEDFGEFGVDDFKTRNVGVAAAATYDSRDNVFTPSSGQFLQYTLWRFDEFIASDYDYWSSQLKLLSFYELHPKFVLGLRIDIAAVEGRVPFYAYPYIKLRGIPALRYQGNRTGLVEIEGRWNILPRWALVGYFGTGMVYYTLFPDTDLSLVRDGIFAGGVGGRYFMMQDTGLWLGVDIARGPEDLYTYITVGHAW